MQEPTEGMSAFDEVCWFFARAAERLKLDEELQQLMHHPWRELAVEEAQHQLPSCKEEAWRPTSWWRRPFRS